MNAQCLQTAARADASQRRAFWLRHLHRWHWISSAVCLIGMMGFAITGFTLNHASSIEGHPRVTRSSARLPTALLHAMSNDTGQKPRAVPAELADFIERRFNVDIAGHEAEWSDGEIYIALPRPGGDAWLSVDRATGDVQYELTTRGWLSYLNDLHKGRNTGGAWNLFIDVFAFACLVFSVTGLFLLKLHARNRGATWPLVGLGVVVPLLLAIVFIH
ncbi:PepSY-associated TM helix domain-containing protein [Caballeronia sp. LZ043]|uniref:PepSY-associated TM helix domain-containing protein n=1 Tax=Caballeronia sp. LZ043 TaxID=3038569 RepID=UPI003857B3FD